MSRYRMIAREDLELKMKSVAAELEKERNRMYHALDVLPVKDFESRDALNHEIAASIGEQRAWRKMWEWVSENYPPEGGVRNPMSMEQLMDLQNRIDSDRAEIDTERRNFIEGPSPLNGRSREEEAREYGDAWREPGRIMER